MCVCTHVWLCVCARKVLSWIFDVNRSYRALIPQPKQHIYAQFFFLPCHRMAKFYSTTECANTSIYELVVWYALNLLAYSIRFVIKRWMANPATINIFVCLHKDRMRKKSLRVNAANAIYWILYRRYFHRPYASKHCYCGIERRKWVADYRKQITTETQHSPMA